MSYEMSGSEFDSVYGAGKAMAARWLDSGRDRRVLQQIADLQPDACETDEERARGYTFRSGIIAGLAENEVAT